MIRLTLTSLIFFLTFFTFGQPSYTITGTVQESDGSPLIGASVLVVETELGTTSDDQGQFVLNFPDLSTYTIKISFIGYQTLDTLVTPGATDLVITMTSESALLEGVEVTGRQESASTVNAIQIDARSAQFVPSPFNDFSKVLATLPGVSSNNELSSAYSVRGGNFDENLVYVNDIMIYRPFLANSGRQEGLSFINTQLVRDINFYSGGWEAKYGDKLSSSLNISYKTPEELEGSVDLGMLGGTAYFGSQSRNERVQVVMGARYRDSKYLLNTLEVQGEYFPRFFDLQSLVTFDLTNNASEILKRTTIEWLSSYNRNRYRTIPTSSVTEFGSVSRNLRIQTAFIGKELLTYDTWQTGMNLKHWFNRRIRTSLIGSTVYTRETEDFEVEGAYRLCDVDNNPSSASFNDCVVTRGIGTQFQYGRNDLAALITNIENRYEWLANDQLLIEAGVGFRNQNIQDQLNEYSFNDSADFVSITRNVGNELSLNNNHFFGYLQGYFVSLDSVHQVNFGIRANHWDQTNQTLLSPRLLYRMRVASIRPTYISFSAGSYQQHPFYRELRDYEGQLQNVKAQRSVHLISGFDRFMQIWDRPFSFSFQAYYKFLMELIPYEVDNLRLRYLGSNGGEGFARGVDMRINGEFIAGTQSWFSLSLLQTQEDLESDGRGLIRRPLDQRVHLGAFFEDHIPADPTIRAYFNLNYGSGYPFGPPRNSELRNVFSGDEYYRVDLGLTKLFLLEHYDGLKALSLRMEVLNVLGADNTLSYTWIEDVNGTSFAIPNSLSARFFNFRISAEF